jgi:NAD+ synthase
MGFSYEELDRYLTTGEVPAKLKHKMESMMAATEHKRQPPPRPIFPA